MDDTKELNEGAQRLPLAYSQGYVYVSVIHDARPDAGPSAGSDTAATTQTAVEQPMSEPRLVPPLAVVAVATGLGPLVGAAAFVVTRIL